VAIYETALCSDEVEAVAAAAQPFRVADIKSLIVESCEEWGRHNALLSQCFPGAAGKAAPTCAPALLTGSVCPEPSSMLLAITTIFGAIYKIMPDLRLKWRDVLSGALVTSVLFTLQLNFLLGRTVHKSLRQPVRIATT
jgi:hypothetical protein